MLFSVTGGREQNVSKHVCENTQESFDWLIHNINQWGTRCYIMQQITESYNATVITSLSYDSNVTCIATNVIIYLFIDNYYRLLNKYIVLGPSSVGGGRGQPREAWLAWNFQRELWFISFFLRETWLGVPPWNVIGNLYSTWSVIKAPFSTWKNDTNRPKFAYLNDILLMHDT